MKKLIVLACLSAIGVLADETLQSAVDDLYESHFAASRQTLSGYLENHPHDPLPHAMNAATYLFAELERGGTLKGNLLSEDRGARRGAVFQPDPWAVAAMNEAVRLTRNSARVRLLAQPEDSNALLALCIVAGVQRDYLALVEHKWRESYAFIRESDRYAKRLLKADPSAYDAYLTKGFTEYLVANLPFYLRWPMSLDELTGAREQGLSDLRIAAQSGRYLKPFAQLLLAMVYLREKREDKTEELLAQLTRQYPANNTFRAEFEKLKAKRTGHSHAAVTGRPRRTIYYVNGFFKKHAQNGRGVKRAAQRFGEFLSCPAERNLALCASVFFSACACVRSPCAEFADRGATRCRRSSPANAHRV